MVDLHLITSADPCAVLKATAGSLELGAWPTNDTKAFRQAIDDATRAAIGTTLDAITLERRTGSDTYGNPTWQTIH